MASRYGHQPIILIGKESAYGTAQTTPTIKLFDEFTCEDGIQDVEIKQKTGKMTQVLNSHVAGYSAPKCTITGILNSSSLTFLIQALTGGTSSPYTFAAADPGVSYTIYRAFPASSSDAGDGDKLTGCVLESLSFGNDSGKITYTATFRAKALDREADLSALVLTTVTDTLWTSLVPFLWKAVTCSLLTASITAMDSFTLDFTNEFADDDAIFQNAASKSADPICGYGGEFGATITYDSVNSLKAADYILDTTDLYDDIISFINTEMTAVFTMKGRYSSFEMPEIDKCKYKCSFKKTLCSDDDEDALSIAVS